MEEIVLTLFMRCFVGKSEGGAGGSVEFEAVLVPSNAREVGRSGQIEMSRKMYVNGKESKTSYWSSRQQEA